MKIALLIRTYNAAGGGAERWTNRFAQRLAYDGHEVHVYCDRCVGEAPGLAVHELETGKDRLAFARQSAQLAMDESPPFDAVHDMGEGQGGPLAIKAGSVGHERMRDARATETPLPTRWFFMPHHGTRRATFDAVTALKSPATRWLRPLAWKLLPRYRAFQRLENRQYSPAPASGLIHKRFIAISDMVRRQMLACGVSDDAIDVIHNGVDTDTFKPADEADAIAAKNLREREGLTDRTVYLLIAHNFRLKGLDALLRVLASINVDVPQAMRDRPNRPALVIVGGGKVDRYSQKALALGLGDDVRFANDQPDTLPWYHMADVYVQPTHYDPCSLTVLEAMACGLPVITTRRNGAAELIGHGIEGLVMDAPDNHDQLRAFMNRYMDAAEREAAGGAARRLAVERSFDRQYESILSLYRGDAVEAIEADELMRSIGDAED